MARLPPGILFLIQNSVTVVVPPAVVYAVLTWQHYLNLSCTLVWTLTLASAPLFVAARISQRYRAIYRAASRAGAILPPRWDGKLPGHFDVMQEMVDTLNKGYPGDFAWPQFMKQGPTVQTNILWDPMYITCDPNVIKTILATEFDNYVKGETFSGFMSPLLGTGVFNSDGESVIVFHRAMTRPFFSKDKISHFELFDKRADLAIKKMCHRFRSGAAIDFQDLVSRFTLDSASEFLFGFCVDSLGSTPQITTEGSLMDDATQVITARRFATAFQEAEHVCSERAWRGWIWPLFETLENKSTSHMKVVDEFLKPIIKDALKKKAASADARRGQSGADKDDKETFLENLVQYTSDPVILHDEVLNILLAGRDTTASTLTFAVYLLCEHPDVLTRLRSEIFQKVGRSGRPTYEDIKEMKYLRAVINETLRLYPAVPFNMRYAVEEGFLPNTDPKGKPFYVPPGTPVSYYPFVMHRNTDYWGPDAMEFDPDRFLDERLNKYLVPNPFIFLPFNAGPRICLGQQFAYNEVSFFLIKLLQRFDSMSLDLEAQPPESLPPRAWSSAWGRKSIEKIWPKVHLTLYVNGGLWVKMIEVAD
ncbi:cytochrome P450 [Rhodofomes roseus]|uniref:Cytochrome P450 n=1 Tax=Rhodofomes roseus TaxID=34475 RepID=A0ABQ8KAW0_9APHY|nr:cytochrome P450 [Rhodofomes roseus]KAH9834523.1 cytochrome P450 [Rhodofomes roseus]